MVLIFTEETDYSTTKLLEKLELKKVDYLIVYPYSKFKINAITINQNKSDVEFVCDDEIYLLSTFSSMWYRRGTVPSLISIDRADFSDLPEEVLWSFNNEIKRIREYLIFKFNQIPSINSLGLGNVNKLIMLEYARASGLKIPNSLVTDQTDQITSYFGSIPLITKGLGYGLRLYHDSYRFYQNTVAVNSEDITADKKFGLSYFQERVTKKVELRIFHLCQSNYCMAIFSQSNIKTQVDYRNYDEERPNRNVPYKLPQNIQNKINRFMKMAKLNCGSIDMIVDQEGNYVFLEVNPVGQFHPFYTRLNIDIYELIADKLYSYET